MACASDNKTVYDVYEFDEAGIAHKSEKKVTIDLTTIVRGYGRAEQIIACFLKQLFHTFSSASGCSASFEGQPTDTDVIKISWRKPLWKLVKAQ